MVAGALVVVLVRAGVAGAATDWSSPALLSSGTLRSAPVLAVDSAGDAFAAWTAYDGSGANTDRTAIEATQRSASGGFAQPETLQRQDPDPGNPDVGGGDSPSIGVADNGKATLAWRPIGNDRPVYATRTLTADWSAPAAPLAKDAGDATGQVFVEPGGHVAALVAGGCLSTNISDPSNLVCLPDPNGQGTADVLADGSAVLATIDAGPSDTTLVDVRTLAAGSTDTSTFSDPVTVATEPDAFDPQLRVTDAGDAYLGFLISDGPGATSLALATLHAGVWSGPTTVATDVDVDYSLAVDRASGSMILAWGQQTMTGDAVQAATMVSPTASPSSAVTLDGDASGGVSAAASGAGTGVVAWVHSDGSVQASLLGDAGFGAAETVSGLGEQAMSVTAAARGVPALLWTAQDGDVETVESAEATPPTTGPPPPQPPVCFDTTAQVLRNGSGSIGLGCSDASGLPITITIVAAPAHGSLAAVDQGSRSVLYTPTAGYTGTDTFSYRASDGTRTSTVAHAAINVVFHPPACGTGATTETNTPVMIPLTCTNPDGYSLTLTILTPPQHGTLSAITGGYVVYTPNTGYVGSDSFGYAARIPDGTSYPGTASIQVVDNTTGAGGSGTTAGGGHPSGPVQIPVYGPKLLVDPYTGQVTLTYFCTYGFSYNAPCIIGVTVPVYCKVPGNYPPTTACFDAHLITLLRHRTVVRYLARADVKVAAGKHRKIALKLSKQAMKILRRKHRLAETLIITVAQGTHHRVREEHVVFTLAPNTSSGTKHRPGRPKGRSSAER